MPLLISHRAGTAFWVELFCTRWMARGSIRRGSKVFSLRKISPDWPWSPPSLLQFVPWLFRVEQSAGRGVHDTPSSTQVRTE